MSLVGLGPLIATAGSVIVPPGPAGCATMADAFDGWLVANAVVNNLPPANMTAAGSAVTGTGLISLTGDATSLRDAITSALGVTDLPGLAIWLLFATAWHTHITTNGLVVPSGFVASPTGGPVTGTGTLSFSSPVTPILSTQMGLTGLNIATWALIEAAITLHLTTSAVVGSLGFTSPNGGGLLVGVSTIS